MKQWRKASVSGKLLRIAISWFQVQVGVSFSIMGNVKAPLPHLESKWIASLRGFLAQIDAHISIDHLHVPLLQRLHDFNLMDAIQSSGQFTNAEVRRLNYCRLYLQVVTVSDLTDVSGKVLDQNKRRGQHSLLSSYTHGVMIHQENPSSSEWKLWQEANLLWSAMDGKLKQPLGDWVLDINAQRQRHFAYWSLGQLWIFIQVTCRLCVLVKDPHIYCETSVQREWTQLPDKAIPMLAVHHTAMHWKAIQSILYWIISPSPGGDF